MRSAKKSSKGLVPLLLVFNLGVAAVIAIQWLGWPQAAHDDEEQGRYGRFDGDLREEGRLKVGDLAPDFTLGTADGKSTVALSSFRADRPVVLVFGSYSCPILRRQLPGLKGIYEHYKHRAEFLFVYIEEAHAADASALRENEHQGIFIPQHKTLEDRCQAASLCAAALEGKLPVLVDTMDNRLRKAYSGWPVRLYVIGEDGRIAYKGSPTPERFTLAEMVGPLEREIQEAEAGIHAVPEQMRGRTPGPELDRCSPVVGTS